MKLAFKSIGFSPWYSSRSLHRFICYCHCGAVRDLGTYLADNCWCAMRLRVFVTGPVVISVPKNMMHLFPRAIMLSMRTMSVGVVTATFPLPLVFFFVHTRQASQPIIRDDACSPDIPTNHLRVSAVVVLFQGTMSSIATLVARSSFCLGVQ